MQIGIIKKLDLYLLKAYLQLFAGTFFICLFIFLMQFTWRYMNELIGKGLTWEILAKFFCYASLILMPMSLPLAILLASLVTFGNLGERLELLSMKASGISLIRILCPVFILASGLSVCSFYFQNNVTPEANKHLGALVYDMKQKSPELEIPEGIFYNEIPGYNLYIEHKDLNTGILYGVMIYNTTNGYDDAQIVLADSGRIQTTAEHMHLKLTLWGGERFQNMQSQGDMAVRANVPYMRETFTKEVDLITFTDTMTMTDAELFSGNPSTKSLANIELGIDSLAKRVDSIGKYIYEGTVATGLMQRNLPIGIKDSTKIVASVAKEEPFDSIIAHLNNEKKQATWKSATQRAEQQTYNTEFQSYQTEGDSQTLREHKIEWHKRFTLSLACLIFFLIGAPLGAIIRKGGLGLPVVISVVIFIFYFIIDTAGMKMGRSGEWDTTFGEWLSTMVLAPIAVFLTYKANNDSTMFDMDGYRNFFRALLGLRISRKIQKKEVIILEPDYQGVVPVLQGIVTDCKAYFDSHHLLRTPNYFKIFFHYSEDTKIRDISNRLEFIVEELRNSADINILAALNQLPVLEPDAHTRPFNSARKNMMAGIFLPVGLFFYLRIWRYRIRLRHDIEQIQKVMPTMYARVDMYALANEISAEMASRRAAGEQVD